MRRTHAEQPAGQSRDRPEQSSDAPTVEQVAALLEARAERVREQELATARQRFEDGCEADLTREQRRVLAEFSVALTRALVTDWTGKLRSFDDATAPAIAVDLLASHPPVSRDAESGRYES